MQKREIDREGIDICNQYVSEKGPVSVIIVVAVMIIML